MLVNETGVFSPALRALIFTSLSCCLNIIESFDSCDFKINGKISNGHARSLVSIKSEESQINLFYDIIENGYSVREVEQLSKEFSSKTYKQISKVKPSKYTVPFKYQKIIHDLSKKTNTSLELRYNENGKGKLIIPFSNDKGLTDLINLLNK